MVETLKGLIDEAAFEASLSGSDPGSSTGVVADQAGASTAGDSPSADAKPRESEAATSPATGDAVEIIDAEIVSAASAEGLPLPEMQAQPAGATKGEEASSTQRPKRSGDRWAGKKLGQFRLIRMHGSGAMGIVFHAQDINLHRVVALKVLRRRIQGMSEARRVDQFFREARAAASINHPNIAQVYQINQHQGWWYLAIEFMAGGSLADLLKAIGPLPPRRACLLCADAAHGLAAAHEAGVIHRDIKPGNLMLSRSGHCKVVDFGLVRLDDANDPFGMSERDLVVGTAAYMPPEIINREGSSPASDVYSLGVTLYVLLTGQPPFKGDDDKTVFAQHRTAPPPDVRELAPHCSPTLARLIQRMMAKSPAERPSADLLATALTAEAAIGAGSSMFTAESTAIWRRLTEPSSSQHPVSTAGSDFGLAGEGSSAAIASASVQRASETAAGAIQAAQSLQPAQANRPAQSAQAAQPAQAAHPQAMVNSAGGVAADDRSIARGWAGSATSRGWMTTALIAGGCLIAGVVIGLAVAGAW